MSNASVFFGISASTSARIVQSFAFHLCFPFFLTISHTCAKQSRTPQIFLEYFFVEADYTGFGEGSWPQSGEDGRLDRRADDERQNLGGFRRHFAHVLLSDDLVLHERGPQIRREIWLRNRRNRRSIPYLLHPSAWVREQTELD